MSIEKLISLTYIPIVVLNIFGSILGAIWLLIIGEWRLVLLLFFSSMLIPLAYSLLLLLILPLGLLVAYFAEKKMNIFVAIFGFINMFIGHLINFAWVAFIFIFMLGYVKGNSPIPYLLYGWQIATGPFQYMASKEPSDSYGSFFAVYLAQLSYLILSVAYFVGLLSEAVPLIIFITISFEIYIMKYVQYSLSKSE